MKRNFEKIQFAKLRRKIDAKYNAVHDELSDCYYNEKSFRNYGVLTKEQFDKLHGLIFLKHEVEFHEENMKQKQKDRIPEEKYNEIRNKEGIVIGKRVDDAKAKIIALKTEGFELSISD